MTITDNAAFILVRRAAKKVYRLADEVIRERERQIVKWGPQTHPSGTGNSRTLMGSDFSNYAAALKAWNDQEAKPGGQPMWAPILLEEIFEALESEDPAHVRQELIESMAVIAAWIEDIDAKGHL